MQFGLLGPLLLAEGQGGPVQVPGARLRVLLAALLLEANMPVSWETLAEAVWDGAPPRAAARTLRSHVARLRRVLGSEAGRVVARDPGYLMWVQPGELDVLEFEGWCLKAGSALRECAWARASDAAARALALWRGEPLLDVPCQVLREKFAPRLEQLRLQVLEDRAEAELRLGLHEPLVSLLRELSGANPLRERFHIQLMLALYRSGRQAEALQAYRDARRVLVQELGIEPGPQLRRLHERILAGDADLTAPQVVATPVHAPDMEVPRQLPAAAGHFTGRHAELSSLTKLLDQPEAATRGTVVISAIDGMAGIGKTALAVHAAHRLAGRFPGGQLFIDLHGYAKGYPPREPGEALEVLLRSLGVLAQQMPEDTDARSALYRQRLADTRTLIVLDNAASEAQVRPLLPGHPGCLVLVTSRRRLKGLDDAHTLSLDLLAPPDAVTLLRTVAGLDCIPVDDPALGEVAQLCGHLPLALRIAGALLRHRPAWNLQHMAALLRDQPRRIITLSDGERDLGAVFDLSYTALGERHRLLFRRLGLVPGPDADAYAAAALLDTDPGTATWLLEGLVDHNLLIQHVPGRYQLHDLLRAHAHTLADHDPEAERDTALNRLLHYYAYTSQSASILIAPHPRLVPTGPAPAHCPALPTPDAARAWLRTERDNLEAAHAHARTFVLDEHAIPLAAGLADILLVDGPFTQALELHEAAAKSAEHLGWPAAHAVALTNLGIVRRQSGDLPGAVKALTQALEIFRETGDRHGEAYALNDLGIVRQETGDYPGASEVLTRVLEIFRETGHHRDEASALTNLGVVRRLAGDYPGASEVLTRVLVTFRETGHHRDEAVALTNLGIVRRQTGDLPGAVKALTQALEIFRETGCRNGEAYALTTLGAAHHLPEAAEAHGRALEIFRQTGDRRGVAVALTNLGIAHRLAGDLPGSAEALTQALEIFRETGHRNYEAWALSSYAATVAADGDLPRALALYRQALAMNRELNKPDGEAVALEGLGECHLSTGDTEPGTTHLKQALEIYQRLGMNPDTERVATRLGDLATARTDTGPPTGLGRRPARGSI